MVGPTSVVEMRDVVGRSRRSTCHSQAIKVTEDRLVIPEGLWGNWEDYVGPICPDPCPGTVIELRHAPFKVVCVRHPVTR